MNGRAVIGVGLVIVMGVIIFSIVGLIKSTMSDVSEKCDACGDDCTMKSCSDSTANTASMFTNGLMVIYTFSSVGILYFSFKKDDQDEYKGTVSGNSLGSGDEYAYG